MDSFPWTTDSRVFLHCKQTEQTCYTSRPMPSGDCGSTGEFASLGYLLYLINYSILRTSLILRACAGSFAFCKQIQCFELTFSEKKIGML